MANSKNITFDQLQAALSRVKSALDGKANTSHGNHVPKTETANNARFLRNDNTWQTITPVNIGAADRSHSHGSYVNQNAFTNIKVGDTTVAADSPTDTLTLTAGANVTLTPDATNDSVTIAAKDTVYTHPTTSGYKHIPSGGSSGQILRWSADGTAAWGSDNNTDTKVTNTLNTTAKAYVTGTTSATTNTGTQVFDTGVYLDTTAGKLVATTFAGALSGNASTATTLQTARKFTIGNTERTFNGSGDVKWTLADIGAAPVSHNHTSLTGITKLQFATEGSDAASISTTVDEANTYFDFNLSDDPGQNDTWRWRFSPSGGTVFNAMTLDASSATAADLVVSGSVTASSFSGNASSATKLQTARNIKIGNTSKSFNGTADVTWTLAEIGAAASSHSHSYVPLSNNSNTIIKADADASSAEEYAQLQAGHNYLRVTSSAGGSTTTQGADKLTFNGNVVYHAGKKPTPAEIGAAATGHTHNKITNRGRTAAETKTTRPAVDGISMTEAYDNGYPITYGNVITLKGQGDGQILVGWSGNSGEHAPVYVRSKRDVADANWSGWAQFYTSANPQTSVSGNAGTATKLATARTLTIGNTGKTFDGSNNVSWSLDEMGVTSAIQVAENDAKMDIRHNYVTKHEVAHYFEGENKWKLDVYSLGSMSASATPTKETMIQNNCQYQRSYLVEHPSYEGDKYGDNYIGYATTYMHFTADYQWNGRVVTDDNGNVYLNDVLVLSTPTCQWTNITLNFKAGWNKLEVLYAEGGGGDGWQFIPEIVVVPGGIMDKMNCYGQNSIGERLNGSAAAWDNAYNRVAEWAYGSVGGSTTINGDKIQANTITANQLAMSDFSNFSQLRPRENLSNRYGYANWGGGGEDYHYYWANGDSEYLPFTINETPNPFKHGDKIGFEFEAYTQNNIDVTVGIWFYTSDNCDSYLADNTAALHLYPGWNSYSAQVTIDCIQAKLARSVAIMMKKGATNYVEVRNVVISRAISNVMIEDRAVTANKLGTIGGFQVEDRLLRGRNGTEGNNYVGMSGDGFGWAFWAGAYNGADAPFHVGHEGHLYATNATLAGTLDGNATTATRLQNARTFTIGNTGKNFDGSGNVSWSLAEIGAAASNHTHDGITGFNSYITTVGNDTYSLDMPNNIDISSWYGVSITNNCANTDNYRQTTVAINARTGEATLRGGITAHGAYMTNNIVFSEAGTSNSNSPGLTWNGSTDGADLYYRTLEADQGQLLINLRDDSNATLAIAWNGEVKATFDSNGYYSGSCYKASCFNARNITVGRTTKAFDGSHDVGFSLGEIGAIGAKGSEGYWGLTDPYDNDHEWIRTTALGLIPYASGTNSSLGTDSWRFNQGYIDYIHSAEMWSNSFHGYLDGTAYAANKLNDRGVVQCETGTNRSEVGGLSMTQVYNSGHPTAYGNILSLRGMGDGQILVGWSGSSGAHAPVYVRSKRDNGDAPWSDWAQFYTTAHPQSDISGNAGSATKLQTARSIGVTGAVSGSANFDGSGNISIITTYCYPTPGNFWNDGAMVVDANTGVAEAGIAIDFHLTSNTNDDYHTRLLCAGNNKNIVNLPTGNGTLALTSDNVASATKLQTARNININGEVSGSASFDGSGDITITTQPSTIYEHNKTLQPNTEWQSTEIFGSHLPTGTYVVQMYVDCASAGFYEEHFSGIMSWYDEPCNDTGCDEIPLHKAGHACNGRHMYLRTARQSGKNPLVLQISSSVNFTEAVYIRFKFRKLI